MEDTAAVFGAWPGDAEVAVALTFDVDGEAAWLAEGPEYGRRLTLLSQARFGPGRGLGRILDLLAELLRVDALPRRAASRPGRGRAHLAGGIRIGTPGSPGHYLHDASRSHRPRLPAADAAAGDHRDAQPRAPVVRHPRPDRRPGEPAGYPGRKSRSHQRRPEPHAGTMTNQQRPGPVV